MFVNQLQFVYHFKYKWSDHNHKIANSTSVGHNFSLQPKNFKVCDVFYNEVTNNSLKSWIDQRVVKDVDIGTAVVLLQPDTQKKRNKMKMNL